MAENISVSKIANYIGQEVTVKGWVYNRTAKGKLVFLLVRDGSGFVQCVAFKGDLGFNIISPGVTGSIGAMDGIISASGKRPLPKSSMRRLAATNTRSISCSPPPATLPVASPRSTR